jgi:hypothetical protein
MRLEGLSERGARAGRPKLMLIRMNSDALALGANNAPVHD